MAWCSNRTWFNSIRSIHLFPCHQQIHRVFLLPGKRRSSCLLAKIRKLEDKWPFLFWHGPFLGFSPYPNPETNSHFAPENRAVSQKEIHLPTTNFQVLLLLVSRRVGFWVLVQTKIKLSGLAALFFLYSTMLSPCLWRFRVPGHERTATRSASTWRWCSMMRTNTSAVLGNDLGILKRSFTMFTAACSPQMMVIVTQNPSKYSAEFWFGN